MEFAKQLKDLRNSIQYTQKQLAEYLGLSANCVCEWEKGRSEPSLSTIRKLAAFFDVSADYLLGLEDDFGTRPATAPVPMGDNYTADERKIIEQYRSIPDKLKVLVRQQLEIYTAPGELLSKPQKK